MAVIHRHRTTFSLNPNVAPSAPVEIDPGLSPGFNGFWLFGNNGGATFTNLARPGWGDLNLKAHFSVVPDALGTAVKGDGSGLFYLDTGLVPSAMGIGGNNDRSVAFEIYWGDTNTVYDILCMGTNSANQLFSILKNGFTGVQVNIFGPSDYNVVSAPGSGDCILRGVLTYNGATKTQSVYVVWRRPTSSYWLGYLKASQTNASNYATPDTNNVQVLGSSFRSNNLIWPAYYVGVAPVCFDDQTALRLLYEPYGMLRPPFAPRRGIASGGGATSVTPGVGSIVFTGAVPTIAAGATLLPGAGSVVITGAAPTIAAGDTVLPGAGSIVFTGFAPSVIAGNTLVPGAGSVVITGFAPLIDGGTSDTAVSPGTGSIQFTGFPPVITGGADNSVVGGGGDSPAESSRRRWLDHQERKRQQRQETHGTKKKYAKRPVQAPIEAVSEKPRAFSDFTTAPTLSVQPWVFAPQPVTAAAVEPPGLPSRSPDPEALQRELAVQMARAAEIQRLQEETARLAEEAAEEDDLEIMMMGA